MITKQPYHKNPWADDPHYIYLGSTSVAHGAAPVNRVDRVDLYALYNPDRPDYISFGARFSDEGSDYESNAAQRGADGEYQIYMGTYTPLAAALFFANHHPDLGNS